MRFYADVITEAFRGEIVNTAASQRFTVEGWFGSFVHKQTTLNNQNVFKTALLSPQKVTTNFFQEHCFISVVEM